MKKVIILFLVFCTFYIVANPTNSLRTAFYENYYEIPDEVLNVTGEPISAITFDDNGFFEPIDNFILQYSEIVNNLYSAKNIANDFITWVREFISNIMDYDLNNFFDKIFN